MTALAARKTHHGATIVEFIVVVPTLLMMIMAVLQAAFAFHAKSQVNHATAAAARAGSFSNASMNSMTAAFVRGMVGYYGGGTSLLELTQAQARAAADLAAANVRIEVLSPTIESFNDYNSPELQAQLGTGAARVIPNDNLGFIRCPRDVPGCNSDPNTNASGQTMADANLLKIRVTYGIPQQKQMPMVGRFYTWALARMNPNDTDAFRSSLVQRGRIPLVAHTTVRMMSPPIEGGNGSNPGPGNNGTPVDPGAAPPGNPLPTCPWWDPSCASCPNGFGSPGCEIPPACDPARDRDCLLPCTDNGSGSCALPPGCQ
ncbi:MAG TPA: TadE family protein, partial [Burkholderiaceae bacterium]|nr:TadE family protein [Burkholderiaceae bacterium]